MTLSQSPQPASNPTQPLAARIQTPVWRTLEILHVPATMVDFEHVDRPNAEPSEAKEVRTALFQAALKGKKIQLEAVNPNNTYYLDQHETGTALFARKPDGNSTPVMWDGPTINTVQETLASADSGRRVLRVFPIQYSEWTSCRDERFAASYQNAGQPIPFVGVGVSVLIQTSDGLIPLTRRGIETPVYPGRLYSPGGGPKPGQTSSEALIEEIVEETGLEKGVHFDSNDLIALAYVSDRKHQGSQHERPEIIYCLQTRMTIAEIIKHRNEAVAQKGQRPGDVWSLEPVLADSVSLGGKVVYSGYEMCPPTEAGLIHLMYYHLLQEMSPKKAEDIIFHTLGQLNKYQRAEYIPPISLADAPVLPRF